MIAAGFLANGVKVYITARKEAPLIEKAKELSEKFNGECIAIPCDLSNMEGIQKLASDYLNHEDSLDILVNNAGAAWGEPYENFSEKGWDKVMDTNVKSMFFLTRDLTPTLGKNASDDEPSRVINIGSIDGINVPIFETFSYSASKAGVIGLTITAARDLARHSIRVCTIAPGIFDTPLMQLAPDKIRDPLLESTQFPHRFGQPSEFGQLASHIVENSYLNGETIRLDSGMRMKPR